MSECGIVGEQTKSITDHLYWCDAAVYDDDDDDDDDIGDDDSDNEDSEALGISNGPSVQCP